MPVVSTSNTTMRGSGAADSGSTDGRQSNSDSVPSTRPDYVTPLTRGKVARMRALIVVPLVALAACKVKDPPPITDRWNDDFTRAGIGTDYYKTGPGYAVKDGALSARGAHNHPLWLRKKLTRDVRIEVDCW